MIERVLFRAAFAVCILIAIVLFASLLGLISNYWASDALIAVFFIGSFAIGIGSYGVYQRFTRADSVRLEAEKWLAERLRPNQYELKRRKTIKRWAMWMPVVIVVLVCVFMDETWAFASHVLHPHSGRLIGYQVSIPFTWTFAYIDSNYGRSIVVAQRYRGLLLAGNGLYIRQRPPFSISTMNFRSTPAGDPDASKPSAKVISTRTLPLGNGTLTCWEELPTQWMRASRYVRCSTPKGDFSGGFNGNDEDAAEFYRTLESIKLKK